MTKKLKISKVVRKMYLNEILTLRKEREDEAEDEGCAKAAWPLEAFDFSSSHRFSF
jgi:hypothetical protein